MAILLPAGKQSYQAADGKPLVGGKVYTYAAGTNTPLATYADAGQMVANSNPVILDARGEALIYWNGSYKVVLADASGATLWTVDNVNSLTSPAPHSYPTVGALMAAPISDLSAILTLVGQEGLFTYRVGDFTGDPDAIASNSVPITQGAWVRVKPVVAPIEGFFGTAFRGDNDLQYLDYWYVNKDGTVAIRLNTAPVDNPGEDRDPAMVQWRDGYYYYGRTIGFNASSFEVRRSVDKNLISGWQHVVTFNCATAANPNVVLAWSPSPFVHPTTGAFYWEVALAEAYDPTIHYMAYVQALTDDLSAYANPVSFGMGTNYIDGSSVYRGNTFYHFAKNEAVGAKYVEGWKSSSYPNPGGWTKFTNGDFLNIGKAVEGPCPVALDNVCHLFLDANADGLFYHTSAPSFDGPWSTPKVVDKGGNPLRHGYFLAIDNGTLRTNVAQALSFYGVDITDPGDAKYIQQGPDRLGQAATVVMDGGPINQAMEFYRAGGNYRVFAARGGPSPFNGGTDFLIAGAGATYIQTIGTDGVPRNSAKFVWSNGFFDAPYGFEPRDMAVMPLTAGWTAPTYVLKAQRDRDGEVKSYGEVGTTGAPNPGTVVATYPGDCQNAAPKHDFVCMAGTAVAYMRVQDGVLKWMGGAISGIDISNIRFPALGSVTNA